MAWEMATLALPRSILWLHGRRDRNRKRVALTFDDGPDAMTLEYLDVLAHLNVRATFFLIGEKAAREPGLVREYRRAGHDVGGHGWSHDAFSRMSDDRLRDELARTESALGAAEGRLRFVRPPRGAISIRSLVQIAAAGYTTVLWSIDSDDCRARDPRIVERRVAPKTIGPGDVVLLHELQSWTIEALPSIVTSLRREGYELVTISELME